MSAATDTRVLLSFSQPLRAVRSDQRTAVVLVLALGALTIVAAILYLALAQDWRSRPFFGALVNRGLMVDGSRPLVDGAWNGLTAGLARGDGILAINGEDLLPNGDIAGAAERFTGLLTRLSAGDVVTVDFERRVSSTNPPATASLCNPPEGDAARCQVRFALGRFGDIDYIGFFYVPFVAGMITTLLGFAAVLLRPHQATARAAAALSFGLALFMFGLFDINTTYRLIPLWIIATIMTGAGFVRLAMVFPTQSALLYRLPYLRHIPFAVAAIFAGVMLALYFNPPSQYSWTPTVLAIIGAAYSGLVILAVDLWRSRGQATTLLVRDQANTILIGAALTMLIGLIWIVNTLTINLLGLEPLPLNTSAAAPFFILPALSLVYAALQTRPYNSDRAVTQTVTYGVLLTALVIAYFLLVFAGSLLVGETVRADNPILVALIVFAMAVLFVPVRARVQAQIDRIYFRTRVDYQTRVEAFAQQLSELVKFEDIIAAYQRAITETLQPTGVFLFTINRQMGDYAAIAGATDVRFAADSPLVTWFKQHTEPIYLEPGKPWQPAWAAERARLQILNAQLVLELSGAQQVNGLVVIGAPQSQHGRYTFEELRFVQALTSQISVAVERAQVIESLEQRVRELDVLSQISQAANFTISYDDLLELISAQTARLIDATHFYIVVNDPITNEISFAFLQEDDERYTERENLRWALGRDLFSEVMRTGQALHVADYGAALAERGAAPTYEDPKLKAWLGVPLASGGRMLGVLAVGSTQAGRIFNADAQRTLSDIAGLAATSIEKARLFAETNVRARQLAALNDISQRIVAAEADVENLLPLITGSATNILNVEAGSLLLTVDDGTNDLQFRVAVGAGQELVGLRIPARRGLVGEVAATGKPVIVNDVARDPRWGGEFTKGGTFKTNNILAVPLITQDRVIGVLEVLNKRDGAFTSNDVELLTSFAAQAAVAIENARLFELTDMQLSARVQELETLDRIDFELNRSLDLVKVADVTVRAALSSSGAAAGALGVVVGDDPQMLQIVVKIGYAPDEAPPQSDGDLWSLERGIFKRVMRTRQPELSYDVAMDFDYEPILRGALSQLMLPMLSGGAVNAILILETNREPRLRLADLPFLQRLTDHASIAVANAQLVNQLDRANQSKNEFVGFVAHELKNPLGSVKGYTEALLGGMLGGLSDQQKYFLSTIRSNADRMNVLISDLNDVTKLETGNMRMEFRTVAFQTILSETIRPFEKQIADKGQTLELEVPEDLPPIHADQNRLIQVLTNLVSNAHKYTPPDKLLRVRAEVRTDLRDSKGRPLGAMLHVQVMDTGIGMSAEDLAQLFKPYFRSDNPLTREQPGTGLGLTITRGIIQQHGGEIWVESELNVGTTFNFTIPLAETVMME